MERKALVVEDNEDDGYLLTLLLKGAGLAVAIAADGRSALEIARREHLDVIILDIQMPEMDGYEVAAHLKGDAELARIPIIGVSSFAMPDHREKAIRMGFAGYIEKPVDPECFAETVLSILGRAAGML